MSTSNAWAAAEKTARSRRAAGSQPADTVGEVMDLEAAAEFLKLGVRTLRSLVARNEIPYRRLGRQLRFSRSILTAWLAGDFAPANEPSATSSPDLASDPAAGAVAASAG